MGRPIAGSTAFRSGDFRQQPIDLLFQDLPGRAALALVADHALWVEQVNRGRPVDFPDREVLAGRTIPDGLPGDVLLGDRGPEHIETWVAVDPHNDEGPSLVLLDQFPLAGMHQPARAAI